MFTALHSEWKVAIAKRHKANSNKIAALRCTALAMTLRIRHYEEE